MRGRASDPLTGKAKEVRFVTETEDAAEAFATLRAALDRVRRPAAAQSTAETPCFGEYAKRLLERKVVTGEIKSVQGRDKWSSTIENHLVPAFGELPVDQIRRAQVELWREGLGRRIRAGSLSPHTGNTWLSVLRVVVSSAVAEYELERNAMSGVKPFDTSDWDTYTEEEPNALTPDEVPRFLALARARYPQFFAFIALGFATGLRPSSLRPLRRRGPNADVLWEQGVLLVRQSQTLGAEVMKTTKNKRHQRLSLPAELLEILHWHVDRLPAGPMRDSDLLFPSRTGGFQARSAVDEPFAKLGEAMNLGKRVSPRAMRRTFQDLARAANVTDVVTRAVSGHVTEAMQRHYSTVNAEEMRQSLARVVSLAGFQEAHRASNMEVHAGPNADPSGMHGGMHAPEDKKAG